MISVKKIFQLKDNYAYAVLKKKEVIIIDPAEHKSILTFINKNKLLLKAILLTHHHTDHTGGVEGILEKIKAPVYSPSKKIKFTTNITKNGDSIDLNFINFEAIKTPGHTMDHIIFYSKENNILFSGDTLFRLGCGRIFEGTYKQMFESLQKIYKLDNLTTVYCGHEYTNTNLDFLLSIFTDNQNLLKEKKIINTQLKEKKSSIPFNLGREKLLNPFLGPNSDCFYEFKDKNNLTNFELFSYLRDLKNNF